MFLNVSSNWSWSWSGEGGSIPLFFFDNVHAPPFEHSTGAGSANTPLELQGPHYLQLVLAI